MLKKSFLLAVLLLWAGLPAFSEIYPRLNGVQVFVLDPQYNGNLDSFFSSLKQKGFDTVFLRVFQNGRDRYHYGENSSGCQSGVYFKTDEACVVRDVLKEAVDAAKNNHMRIYAWMATRSLTFLKTPDDMEARFSPDGTVDGYGVSIFVPDVRNRLLALFADLASYDIDGILFQDDFVMFNNEGASEAALWAYYEDSGQNLSYGSLFTCPDASADTTHIKGSCPNLFLPWARWKNRKMMEFFSELKRAAMSVNPNIRFAGNVYYETPLSPERGLSWYAQSVDAMLNAGYDYFAVMGYHDQIASELNVSDDEAVSMVDTIAGNLEKEIPEKSRILMKYQIVSFDKSRQISPESLKKICDVAEKHQDAGRVALPVNNIQDIDNTCFAN